MSILEKDKMLWESLKNPEEYQKWQEETSRRIKARSNLREQVQALLKKQQQKAQ